MGSTEPILLALPVGAAIEHLLPRARAGEARLCEPTRQANRGIAGAAANRIARHRMKPIHGLECREPRFMRPPLTIH
jgi:hypothetical protein